MRYAIDIKGNKISIDKALLALDEQYFCPCCGEELIIKNGCINEAHFAHKSLKDCDDFSSDMSEWHLN